MIPNTVEVAGIGYEIEEGDNLERDFDHLGQILYTKGIIKVDSNIATDNVLMPITQFILDKC